jgi:GT2 family glycosyltransferase
MPPIACSVVIPTHNRARGLDRLLDSLAQQDLPASEFEVIIVDDGSSDGTAEVLGRPRPFAWRAVRQRNQGPAAARNAAVQIATGEIVVMVDDDVVTAPDLLRRHLEAHETEPGVAVIGKMALAESARLSPWAAWEANALYKQYEAMLEGRWTPTPRQFYTANASLRRDALLAAGLFDPLFRRAEDVELAYRLRDNGLGFRFAPEAIVYHRPGRSYAAWRRMARRYGYYDVAMWRRRGRAHVMPVIGHEFVHQRNAALRFAARLLVGRRGLLAAFAAGASAAAYGAAAARLGGASRSAYSAVFNLLYWQGVCEALGSREAFWAGLELWRARERAPLATAEGEG